MSNNIFNLSSEELEKIFLNIIDKSEEYEWLESLLEKKIYLTQKMLERIKKINSNKIIELLKINYNFEN